MNKDSKISKNSIGVWGDSKPKKETGVVIGAKAHSRPSSPFDFAQDKFGSFAAKRTRAQ